MILRPVLTILFLFFSAGFSFCQFQVLQQYFDGADTAKNNSIIIQFDTGSPNIWQVGKPQKKLFTRAATVPKALVTDTVKSYPNNNTSRASFKVRIHPYIKILAIR